ncbi:hypothetical protein SDC9_193953 [bioreactor metagenome]|uniref:Uncharacterized protein n=1 Tax=bioreactor metagenome TaxID=1076179 RepID=A0A645I4Y7_9ZZZZ
MLRPAVAQRGNHGKQQARQHQQRHRQAEHPLSAVVALNLAAKSMGGAGGLGVCVPPVPFVLIQRYQIRLGGGRRRAAGLPKSPAL